MGVVYVAEHPLLGRRAAIKMLLPEYSRDQEFAANRQKFLTEQGYRYEILYENEIATSTEDVEMPELVARSAD